MVHALAVNNLANGNMAQDQFDIFLNDYEQTRAKLLKFVGDE